MNLNTLFTALQDGAIVITPNNRLTEQLLRQYLNAAPKATCKKPQCFAYPTFLREMFYQLIQNNPSPKHPILLSAAHIQSLWRDILGPEGLDHSQTLINTLQQAFVICEYWQISLPHPDFQLTPQTEKFESFRLNLTQRLQ